MLDRDAEGDAAATLLERRWFASMTAVRGLRAECDALREVMEMSESAWRRARKELIRLEALRDALGEELAERDGQAARFSPQPADRAVSSAA